MSRWLDAVPLLARYGLYRGLMFIAVGLTLAMALLSATDKQVHHDEYDHVEAARFYFEHWVPPKVGDPRALDSYSLFGMSYTNEWDVVYPLAGKFAQLIRPIVRDDVVALRLFNVGLFLVLACITLVRRDDVLALALLLTSSQIWYVFSYFNGDAFPLFLSFLTVVALTSSRSNFNSVAKSTLVRYLPLGICVGLLVLSKRTFWAFGLFAICYAAWLEYAEHRHIRTMREFLRSSALLGVVIFAVAFPRIGHDLYVNGPPSQKVAKLAETAEALALPYFKPSTNLREETNLRRKGVSIVQMMKPPYRWAEVSAVSAFGSYNYMTMQARPTHYSVIYSVYALFLAYLIIAVSARGNVKDRVTLLGGGLFCLLIIGLSIHHSWVNDFQAQGRYLFGIFAILGVVLARSKRMLDPVVVNLFLLLCFFWSVYSFCGTGLANVPLFVDVAEINPNFRRP